MTKIPAVLRKSITSVTTGSLMDFTFTNKSRYFLVKNFTTKDIYVSFASGQLVSILSDNTKMICIPSNQAEEVAISYSTEDSNDYWTNIIYIGCLESSRGDVEVEALDTYEEVVEPLNIPDLGDGVFDEVTYNHSISVSYCLENLTDIGARHYVDLANFVTCSSPVGNEVFKGYGYKNGTMFSLYLGGSQYPQTTANIDPESTASQAYTINGESHLTNAYYDAVENKFYYSLITD